MNEAYGGGNDAGGPCLALADEVAEFHQGCGGVAESKQCFRMFLDSQSYAGLCASNALPSCQPGHPRVAQIAHRLDAQPLQGSFANAAGHHGDVGDDGSQLAALYLIIYSLQGLRVGVQNVLHVEVGRRVDGVQQSPLMSERIVLAMQFSLDGAERLHHNLLAHLQRLVSLTAVVAARCNKVAVGHVRLRVADKHYGEHVNVLRVEVAQGSELYLLLRPAGLTNVAHRRRGRTLLEKQFLQTVQLPVAAVRLGIVDGSDKVARGGSTDATLDDVPRRHQVRQ